MPYIVDLSKSPDILVKELFNHFNESQYNVEHLTLTGDAVTQEGAYNTYQHIEISPPPANVDVGRATIHYNRIELTTLFSVVEVTLREVDIKADGTFDPALILAEVQRKYGINTSTGQFGITTVEGQDYFYAKNSNSAFIGSVPVIVEWSLETRVDNALLNGFSLYTEVVFDDAFITHSAVLPTELRGQPFQAVELDGYLYAVANRVCRRLDLDTGIWTTLANCIGHGNRRASIVVGGKIYVAGGWSGSSIYNTFEVYDPTTNRWTELASLPLGLFGATILHSDGRIYLYGGFARRSGNSRLTTMYMYDISTNRWTYLGEYGQSGQSCAGVAFEGKFYYHGGVAPGDAVRATNYTFVFDPATNTETELAAGPNPVHGAAGVEYNGKMYIFGGDDNKYLDVSIYDISTDTWTTGTTPPFKHELMSAVFMPARQEIVIISGRTNKSIYIYS